MSSHERKTSLTGISRHSFTSSLFHCFLESIHEPQLLCKTFLQDKKEMTSILFYASWPMYRTWLATWHLRYQAVPIAELIACSTRGSACILAISGFGLLRWVSLWHMASCIKRADTYFGRRSASQIKEFWTLCILLMTVSETVMVETIPYSNIGLTHCL